MIGEGLLHSFSQVFFSKSRVLAGLLILVSFFDLNAGCSALLAVLIGQVTAILFNFNRELVRDGTYTYNEVLVGLALGVFYDFSLPYLVLLVITAMLTFFLTLWFASALGKKNLPFLSIPFLVAIWIVILGAGNFTSLVLKEKETISLAVYFPELFSGTTSTLQSLPGANAILLYLRSLGAILFQYNDLAGVIVAIAILISSRISFVLSIYGFLIGYLFYARLEGDFTPLVYSYIGFNFVLTAMALGGFFTVASRRSFLLLAFTIPVSALLISALHTLFTPYQLPLYSLPFNIVVWLFLGAMFLRSKTSGLELVTAQTFSPEENHYRHFNNKERFRAETHIHIALPVMGNWTVSQGHGGNITHKEDWQYAWDFDIRDDMGNTYRAPGLTNADFYCFDVPVVAPATGWVVKVQDGIDDNDPGEVNVQENWGNTVVIKHADHLYSKLSHFRKDSIKVKEGDYVRKGDVLGNCGSSGRSPEPHLHFQIQATPFIGSATMRYPIGYYLTVKDDAYTFHAFDIPAEGETVSNVHTTPLLADAFGLVPGKKLTFETEENGTTKTVTWEVFTNALNQTYLYCTSSGATAYFINNGTLFFFTAYYGKKDTLLHQFYLGAHKVLLGYYPGAEVTDRLMTDAFFAAPVRILQDFTAPFFHFIGASYTSRQEEADTRHHPKKLVIESQCQGEMGNRVYGTMTTRITLENHRIQQIEFIRNSRKTIAQCID